MINNKLTMKKNNLHVKCFIILDFNEHNKHIMPLRDCIIIPEIK
jgi:hypothetical protein